MCGTDCFLMLLSVLFPPIGVWVKRGVCSADGLINIALCCLGFLPGLLHAWYIILKYPEPYEYEALGADERGDGVTYYVVARGPAARGQRGYGTVSSQPTAGQFPGQQSGTVNAFPKPKNTGNAPHPHPHPHPPAAPQNGEGSRPSDNPPTYADAVKGDHKIQGP